MLWILCVTFNHKRYRCVGPSSLSDSCNNSDQVFWRHLFVTWSKRKLDWINYFVYFTNLRDLCLPYPTWKTEHWRVIPFFCSGAKGTWWKLEQELQLCNCTQTHWWRLSHENEFYRRQIKKARPGLWLQPYFLMWHHVLHSCSIK